MDTIVGCSSVSTCSLTLLVALCSTEGVDDSSEGNVVHGGGGCDARDGGDDDVARHDDDVHHGGRDALRDESLLIAVGYS